MVISLTILGEPKAQKRHRHVKMGSFVRTYDPSTANKKDLLHIVQQQAPPAPIDTPIRVDIDFYFSRPKGHYGTGKNANVLKDTAPILHTTKPDIDNCFKFVTDALSGVFYKDDNLICETHLKKLYSDKPRIEITIATL